MNFKILEKKPIRSLNNEDIIDLTHQSIDFNREIKITNPPILITDETAGRPHLLSKILYGTEDSMDLLCTFNGISNPLTLDSGDIMIAPDVESMEACLKDPLPEIGDTNLNKKLLNQKLNQKDLARIEKIKKDTQSDLSRDDIRTPNLAKDGVPSTIAVDGKIILGTNISDARCKTDNLSNTQKITERIRKALKEKVIAQKLATVSVSKQNTETIASGKKFVK